MINASYQLSTDVFDEWRGKVLTGTAPVFYKVGKGDLSRIEIGPGLVTLIGGAPGAGKTAFTMQCVIDSLRLNSTLRVLVCNVEMVPAVLLDRQLSRLSGIDVTTIRYRKLGDSHADRLDQAFNTLEGIADRLCFLKPPFNLENVVATADEFDPGVILLDYIQRISPPGTHSDRRGSVDATMNYIRQFADADAAVVVVSAVARQKDRRGRSSYEGDSLSLASFRESSELEFGADDAFILTPDSQSDDRVTLRHLKARHTEPHDISLIFDRRRQSFKPVETATQSPERNSNLPAGHSSLWQPTEAASLDTGAVE